MTVWLAIALSGVVTYLTRATALVVDAGVSMPAWLGRYLDALPVAIIAALVGRAVIAPADALTRGAEPLAALAAVLVTLWRRNLLLGTLTGVACIAALRFLGLGS